MSEPNSPKGSEHVKITLYTDARGDILRLPHSYYGTSATFQLSNAQVTDKDITILNGCVSEVWTEILQLAIMRALLGITMIAKFGLHVYMDTFFLLDIKLM